MSNLFRRLTFVKSSTEPCSLTKFLLVLPTLMVLVLEETELSRNYYFYIYVSVIVYSR